MFQLPKTARDLIQSGAIAHLVTLNADGSPQVSAVWTGFDGDEIVIGSIGPRQKLDNVARDPRVALSWQREEKNPMGLQHYLVVNGTARIQEGGAPALLQRLADVYLGAGIKFPPMDNPPPGFVMRITAERIYGTGPWMEEAVESA
jgi:PPOX class probable F420-dependent enzyme